MLWILALAKARSAESISAMISAKRATQAKAKIHATVDGARQKGSWRRRSVVTARCRGCASLAPCHPPFCLYARPIPVFQQSPSSPCDSRKTYCNNRRRNICSGALLGVGCFFGSPHLPQVGESGSEIAIDTIAQSAQRQLPPRDVIAAEIDSHLPICSPSGLEVYVVRSYELHCRGRPSRPRPS